MIQSDPEGADVIDRWRAGWDPGLHLLKLELRTISRLPENFDDITHAFLRERRDVNGRRGMFLPSRIDSDPWQGAGEQNERINQNASFEHRMQPPLFKAFSI